MSTRSKQLSAAPVLKWAGGKRRLLRQYEPHFPTEFGSYFEPFFGGGAVFFWLFNQGLLRDTQTLLNDVNPELVNFYSVLRNDCESLIERLHAHRRRHGEEYYYDTRRKKPRLPVTRAARLMYLNRTCFNGLYRVNSKGQFNVPMGRYKNPSICDAEGLRAASSALGTTQLTLGSFKDATKSAKPGDLVYFDPPYVPLNPTSSFTSYTRENFTLTDQQELADTFRELAARGVKVCLSNSDTPLVRELYEGFEQHVIMAPRAINSKADRRQKVSELLIIS
jgi:DNA adenine methylase